MKKYNTNSLIELTKKVENALIISKDPMLVSTSKDLLRAAIVTAYSMGREAGQKDNDTLSKSNKIGHNLYFDEDEKAQDVI